MAEIERGSKRDAVLVADDEEEEEEEEDSSDLSESDEEDFASSALAARILAAKNKGSGEFMRKKAPEDEEKDESESEDEDDDKPKEASDAISKDANGEEIETIDAGIKKKKKKNVAIRFEGEAPPGVDLEAEEAAKYAGTVDPKDDDKNRCLRAIQPQDEKGRVWKYPIIKNIVIHDNKIWFSARRSNFAFLTYMDATTGVLSHVKPMKWEWPPVWLACDPIKNQIFVSDIRYALRWADMNPKSLREQYLKEAQSRRYLDGHTFLFDEEGRLYNYSEPSDHKTFAINVFHRVEGKPDVWSTTAKKLKGHTGRIRYMLFVGSGDNQQLWTGTRNGEIGIWGKDGSRIKIIQDAHKAKRSCHSLATDGQFVYSGGSDKRVYKWSLAGDRLKRIIIRKHIYALAAKDQFLYIGLENGDIQIRNPLAQVIAIFKPPMKDNASIPTPMPDAPEPGSVAAAKEKQKERRAHHKGKKKKDGKGRKYVRELIIGPNNNLYAIQPNYHCVLEWNIAGIEQLKYSGSMETAPVYYGIKEKSGPFIPDSLGCNVS